MTGSNRILAAVIVLLLSAFCPDWKSSAQTQTSERQLSFGSVIESEIERGQEHRYLVNLSSGQAVQVAATQQHKTNLILGALAENGKAMTEVNCMDGSDEIENMTFVAENSGQYVITIRLTKNSSQSGRYRLLAQLPRIANQSDKDRVAAQNDYQTGRELRNLKTGEARRKAIPLAESALRVWQTQSDPQWEAVTLHLLGMLNYELGDAATAMGYFNRALPIKQRLGLRDSVFSTLTFICTSLGDLGNNHEALSCQKQALQLSRELGDEESNLLLLADIGLSHMLLGEKEPARQYFIQALADSRASGQAFPEGLALQNLGSLFRDFGEYQQSLEYYEQAVTIRRKLGDKRRLGVTLSNIGTLHVRLNDDEKAAPYFHEAHLLFQETGNQNDLVTSFVNLARLEIGRTDYQKALDYLFQSLELSKKTQNPRSQYRALNAIADAQMLLNEFSKAEESLRIALPIGQELGDPQFQMLALQKLGQSALKQKHLAKSQSYFQQSLRIAKETNDIPGETDALSGLAEIEAAENNLPEALKNSSRAIDLIESLRSKILKTDLRSSFFAGYQSPYQTHIEILMRLHEQQPAAGYAAQALSVSERARARNLLDTLTETNSDLRAGLAPELLTEEQNLRFQVSQQERARLAALSNKAAVPQAELLDKVTQLLSDYETLKVKIRQTSPRYAALTQPQPLTAEQIQKLLDKETVLLEYALGEKRSVLWAVTTDSVTSFSLPPKDRIEEAAHRCHNLTKDSKHRRWQHAADLAALELSRLILPPSPELQRLLNRNRLVVVADGALQYIPFGLLPVPTGKTATKSPLLSSMEIVSLPSASTLAVLRDELKGRQKPSKLLAIFSDPVFHLSDSRIKTEGTTISLSSAQPDSGKRAALLRQLTRSAEDIGLSGFARLPYSRQEAEAILALTADPQNLKAFDFTASRATALSAGLNDYRIIHFATHGLLNSRHPELSGLALSLVNEKGEPQDGFLRMTDLYNLKLNADLVVLSACRTAMGKDIKGEGLIGLTRGFMYAGTPRIVASLWDVNDAATAELMSRFYKHLLKDKLPAAAALRAAQLSISRESRWAAPYYWAGFVIQGDWQEVR